MTQSEFLPLPEYKTAETGIQVAPIGEFPKQDFSLILGKAEDDTPLYKTWFFSFTTVGQVQTVFTDAGRPDYWLIYVLPTWSATPGQYSPAVIGISQSATPAIGATPEVALAGGGTCRIPGLNDMLTVQVRSIGTQGTNVGILAIRKWSETIDVFVEPGTA